MSRVKITPLSVIKAILLCAVALVPASAGAQTTEKKGTTPYVTHFIFRPIMSIDIPGLGTATNLTCVAVHESGNWHRHIASFRRAAELVRYGP